MSNSINTSCQVDISEPDFYKESYDAIENVSFSPMKKHQQSIKLHEIDKPKLPISKRAACPLFANPIQMRSTENSGRLREISIKDMQKPIEISGINGLKVFGNLDSQENNKSFLPKIFKNKFSSKLYKKGRLAPLVQTHFRDSITLEPKTSANKYSYFHISNFTIYDNHVDL